MAERRTRNNWLLNNLWDRRVKGRDRRHEQNPLKRYLKMPLGIVLRRHLDMLLYWYNH
jgi:hypothetical protein